MGLNDSGESGLRGMMRAADADRDRVVEFLNGAYTEGRLTKDEYDERLEQALSARTYGDLDLLIADLPAAHATMAPPATGTSVEPAEAEDQQPRDSERRLRARADRLRAAGDHSDDRVRPHGQEPDQAHREQGAGLALIGLLLGWGAVALGILFITVAVVSLRTQPPPSFPTQP